MRPATISARSAGPRTVHGPVHGDAACPLSCPETNRQRTRRGTKNRMRRLRSQSGVVPFALPHTISEIESQRDSGCEGLQGTSYPGYRDQMGINPDGVVAV